VLRPGQVIILCVLALLSIGVVMVNSAGMSVSPDGTGAVDSDALFWALVKSRPVVYLLLALCALVTCSLLPIGAMAARVQAQESPRSSDTVALAVGAMLLVGLIGLVYLPVIGREVNGSSRWIEVSLPGLGPQSIQPSEVAKWGLVLLLAWYATRRGGQMRSIMGGLAPSLGVAALIAGLVALEDLGPGVLIAAVAGIVLVGAGARLWPFLALAPVGLAGIGGLILASPYRLERVRTFLDPYADPQGSGYHMIQSMAGRRSRFGGVTRRRL
jgi:cell division protein FtsW